MRLIHNWKNSCKFLSSQAHIAQVAVGATWLSIPEDLRRSVPQWTAVVLVVVLGILGFMGRLVHQGDKDGQQAP